MNTTEIRTSVLRAETAIYQTIYLEPLQWSFALEGCIFCMYIYVHFWIHLKSFMVEGIRSTGRDLLFVQYGHLLSNMHVLELNPSYVAASSLLPPPSLLPPNKHVREEMCAIKMLFSLIEFVANPPLLKD
jgi:hypothetical protein